MKKTTSRKSTAKCGCKFITYTTKDIEKGTTCKTKVPQWNCVFHEAYLN
ncbi:MAG: hypothetical protein HRT98_04400 [Mycoplasmatales bacterium]|nr:hypothetical protein [Mycoplasmatales bacterium]